MLGRIANAAKAAALILRHGTIEAGGSGRRWGGAMLRRPATEIGARREAAGARAAWLAMNSPHAAALVSAWVTNTIADGPSVRPMTDNVALRRSMIAAWNRFWSTCDADGLSDFGGLLSRSFRSTVVDGESFVALGIGPDSALQLRLLSPRQVDATITRPTGGGGRIVNGIEFDRADRRVAYWIKPLDDVAFMPALSAVRVSADDVLHAFDPVAIGQVRGLSWLAPVASRLAEIDRLEDALLAKFNVAALFAGVVERESAGDLVGGTAENGIEVGSLEPGALVTLPPGTTVKFSSPPSTEGSVEFLRAMQRSAAAGGGVPYALMSGDLSDTNYSSARLGLLEFRRRVVAVQRNLVTAQLLAPIWRRFVVLEHLAGRLPAEAMAVDASWLFPGWAQIDPVKETNADAAAVTAGFKSRAEVIASRGRDIEDVDAERAADTFTPAAKEPANA